jgi:hypothetical protein
VKRSLDIKETARNNWLIDQAMQSATSNINQHMHRKFHPMDATRLFDWPNFQRAAPWKIWLDASELADVTANVPVVTAGGVAIPASAIFWGPWNDAPPYTFLELDRSQSYAFGAGSTPQRSVAITGTFGYKLETDPGGTLAAAITSTSATTATCSNSAAFGVGSLLIIDSERILVQDVATATTGQANVSGATTNVASDNAITVTAGTAINPDEVLLLDQEKMLAVDVTGNVVTVIRAWDGSALATHSTSTTIYAYRALTIGRGQFGTAGTTHLVSAPILVFRYPSLIRDLAIAESGNTVLQRTSGYAEVGEGATSATNIGAGLADLWDEAETAHGRKSRSRVV